MPGFALPACPKCNGYRLYDVNEDTGAVIAICPHDHTVRAPSLEEVAARQDELRAMMEAYEESRRMAAQKVGNGEDSTGDSGSSGTRRSRRGADVAEASDTES